MYVYIHLAPQVFCHKMAAFKKDFSPFDFLDSHLMAFERVSKVQGLFSQDLSQPTLSAVTNTGVTDIPKGYMAALPVCQDDTTAVIRPSFLPVPLTDVARQSQQLLPHTLFLKKKRKKKDVDRRELRAWARLRQDSPKLFLLGGT